MIADGIGIVDDYSELHMWNIVRLGGMWYAVDVTWDDNAAQPKYDYFLVGSRTEVSGLPFDSSHIFEPLFNEQGREFTTHPLSPKGYAAALSPCLWKTVKRPKNEGETVE